MKNILIITGTHGNEQSAIQLGLRLKKYYKERNVKVIPFLNESGIEANTREVQDNSTTDLNRSFSEDVLPYNKIVNMVKDVVQSYDVIIDIHNSPRCSNFCLIDAGQNEDIITKYCYVSDVEYATRFSTGGTIKDYCNSIGKIGITYEFSGMSTLNSSNEIDLAFRDVTSLVKAILKTEKIFKPNRQNLKSLHCLETGFIYFIKDINDTAEPGDVIFEVVNENSEVIEVVRNEYKNYDMKIIAIGHSYQTRGSSVLQYVKKKREIT